MSASDSDHSFDSYSAAVVQLPARLDGRVALARKGFFREPVEAAMPEVKAGTEKVRRKFRLR
jgi:hypothetical protein